MSDVPKLCKVRRELSQLYLHELITYNPYNGEVRWKVKKSGNTKAGDIVGRLKADGYRGITIDRKEYYLHRIIWMFVYGHFPEAVIDHINGIKNDNRLSNLREATFSQNNQNRGMLSNNTSGFQGICWIESSQKWRASVGVSGRPKYLGLYLTKEAAFEAYLDAIKKIKDSFYETEEVHKYVK